MALRVTFFQVRRTAVREHFRRHCRILVTEGTFMYCNACGKAIVDDGRFCSYCGNVVGNPPIPKKLIRSRSDRKIAGVCSGFAHYLELDVSLVRILWFFIMLATGVVPGLIAYILAWIIIPEEPELKPVVAANQPITT
jgi:phage shock protein C